MSQPDEHRVPNKIPDDLWHIKCLKAALATFAFDAQMYAQEKNCIRANAIWSFIAGCSRETVNQMRFIKRYAPVSAEIIPFPTKNRRDRISTHHPDLRSPIRTR